MVAATSGSQCPLMPHADRPRVANDAGKLTVLDQPLRKPVISGARAKKNRPPEQSTPGRRAARNPSAPAPSPPGWRLCGSPAVVRPLQQSAERHPVHSCRPCRAGLQRPLPFGSLQGVAQHRQYLLPPVPVARRIHRMDDDVATGSRRRDSRPPSSASPAIHCMPSSGSRIWAPRFSARTCQLSATSRRATSRRCPRLLPE